MGAAVTGHILTPITCDSHAIPKINPINDAATRVIEQIESISSRSLPLGFFPRHTQPQLLQHQLGASWLAGSWHPWPPHCGHSLARC
jgi:hypothetical protein